jgi:hypothetical protein
MPAWRPELAKVLHEWLDAHPLEDARTKRKRSSVGEKVQLDESDYL